MSTDDNIVSATLNTRKTLCFWKREFPPGTLICRQGSPRASDVHLVIHIVLKTYPGKWTEVCMTTLGRGRIQELQLEVNNFTTLWSKVA